MRNIITIMLLLLVPVMALSQSLHIKPTKDIGKDTNRVIPPPSAKLPKPNANPKKEVKKLDQPSATSTIKFVCDADAHLFIDGYYKGKISKDAPQKVDMEEGEYFIRAISSDFKDTLRLNHKVEKSVVEKLVTLPLQTIISARSDKEQKERQAEADRRKKLEEDRLAKEKKEEDDRKNAAEKKARTYSELMKNLSIYTREKIENHNSYSFNETWHWEVTIYNHNKFAVEVTIGGIELGLLDIRGYRQTKKMTVQTIQIQKYSNKKVEISLTERNNYPNEMSATKKNNIAEVLSVRTLE